MAIEGLQLGRWAILDVGAGQPTLHPLPIGWRVAGLDPHQRQGGREGHGHHGWKARAARVSQISVVDGGGGDFNSGFDIATAPVTVRVSQLQDTSGTTDVVASGSGKVQFLDWRAIGSAALADVDRTGRRPISWSVAASGGQVLNIQNTGDPRYGPTQAPTARTRSQRHGPFMGRAAQHRHAAPSQHVSRCDRARSPPTRVQVLATLGLGGYSSAPRNVQLQAELASSAAGTDVAASTFNLVGSRGTGASTTGGDINFTRRSLARAARRRRALPID